MRNLALVYDLEIVKAIPVQGEVQYPDIEYCAGWDDHANMGISVLCAYDYAEDRYRVFCGDNLEEFAKLAGARGPLVGFNTIGFDNHVLRANGINVDGLPAYDMLDEIWRRLGRRMKGYRLDDCTAANFQEFKSGHGAMAPVLWQRGQIGATIDYCLQDVRLEKRLFDRIVETGGIVDPVTQRQLALRQPVFSELGVPLA